MQSGTCWKSLTIKYEYSNREDSLISHTNEA